MKVVCRNCKYGLLSKANYKVDCKLDGITRHSWDTCEKGEYEDDTRSPDIRKGKHDERK